MIVDSHCHLNSPQIFKDLDSVIKRAIASDVKIMQTVCTKLSEFEEIKKIATDYESVFCSVGLHPNHTKDEALITARELADLTQQKKTIGLGETGLDYYRGGDEEKELQKKSFINHIEASQITGIPLIIHSRDAEKDMAEILKKQMSRKKFKAVLHCFNGSKEFANFALELGLYISISGIVTFTNAKLLQNVVKDLPLNRLLVETDAPYLTPAPFRGKINEPSFTKYTVEALSKLLEESFINVANATTANFFELFQKASFK